MFTKRQVFATFDLKTPSTTHFACNSCNTCFHISTQDEKNTLSDTNGSSESGTVFSPQGTAPSPQTSTPLIKPPPQKTLQLPSPPEYVIYTDSELELARNHYFEMACSGREREAAMSKELRCRLVRNTVTNMIVILRASQQGEEIQYPSKHKVTAMAKKIVEYYPMLQEKDLPTKHVWNNFFFFTNIYFHNLKIIRNLILFFDTLQASIYSYLYKRIMNVKSSKKRQGPTPERGHLKKRHLSDFSPCDQREDYDADSSGGSTILFLQRSSSDDGGSCK